MALLLCAIGSPLITYGRDRQSTDDAIKNLSAQILDLQAQVRDQTSRVMTIQGSMDEQKRLSVSQGDEVKTLHERVRWLLKRSHADPELSDAPDTLKP